MAPFGKRCRHYEPDGTPIGGGCFKLATSGDCRFVHPGDHQWSSAQPPPSQFMESRGRSRGRRGGNTSRGGGPTASGWGSSDLTTSTTPSTWAAPTVLSQKEKDTSLGWGNTNWGSSTELNAGAFGSSNSQSWATSVSTVDTVGHWADTTASWGSSSGGAWGVTELPGDGWALPQPTHESLADSFMAIDLGNIAPMPSEDQAVGELTPLHPSAGLRDADMTTNVSLRINAPPAQKMAPELETSEPDSEEVDSTISSTADDGKRKIMQLFARAVAAQHELADAENELRKRRRLKNSTQFQHPGEKARKLLDNLTLEPKRKGEEARLAFNDAIEKLLQLDYPFPTPKDTSKLAEVHKDIEDLHNQLKHILSIIPEPPVVSRTSTTPTVPAKRRREEESELISGIIPRLSKLENKVEELKTYFDELVNWTVRSTIMDVAPRESHSIHSVEEGEILPQPSPQQNVRPLSAQLDSPQAKIEHQLRNFQQAAQDLANSIEPPGVPPFIYNEDALENLKSEIMETVRADMADALTSLRTHLVMILAEQQEILCARIWQDLQPVLLLTGELYGIISAIDSEAGTTQN